MLIKTAGRDSLLAVFFLTFFIAGDILDLLNYTITKKKLYIIIKRGR